ncbi:MULTISPECIES: HAMP domain-containing sensor histidine kinase [Clostridium]|uniref:histidine kinase n=1 Tax=Clostridium novyi (strain NT) TaxID=386415 RepID=A0PYF6_CLONN|nr:MULTISPECIES: HAMP domain-containing sensor histidine kinase [Clostridium]ABK61107.1 two-component sensor histidine kinase [Clostridium novyi NT]KEH86695.1 histidine kinase [Clostridium novyi A str. NCTC 538]KEH89073.1 histidine kinase [Clostridium novyi A str. 4540]KEH90960.1 histidine kinase [Clostridium novyi A str. BKT29909]KEH92998.1 histidine kinase [Clostridium botulinum C/D str. It1]
MKLKNWLISSYIVVMILPIIIAIMVYNGIKFCSNRVELEYYLNTLGIISKYENRLENLSIYKNLHEKVNLLDKEDNGLIEIDVYDNYGTLIYSSEDKNSIVSNSVNIDELYKNLYVIKREYNYNVIKRPVFSGDKIVGFYKIKILKNDVVNNINSVVILSIIVFILALIEVFVGTIHFLNKKILNPMSMLVKDMKAYTRGDPTIQFEYNKSDEVGDLINHFNELKGEIEVNKKEIERQHKEKEYLIAALSHDLKTPLTAIRAYSEAINRYDNLSEDTIKDYSSIIINKSDYMKKMLEDLLAYTLLTTEEELNLVEVDGEEFLEMLFYGYDELCEKNNIILIKNIDVRGNYCLDVNSMIRVIDNLISNSIRYTKNGGKIYLGAYSEEGNLPKFLPDELVREINKNIKENMFVFVSNNGDAIPESEQSKIFKAFYQSDNSRSKSLSGGVGLGLSIVKVIMDKHQGSVKIFSKDGFGTLVGCFIKRKS